MMALSSTEVNIERLALGCASRFGFVVYFGFSQQQKTILRCDNRSCLAIARNSVFHAQTKHIKVQYHFVREKLLDGTILLEYCKTEDNLADLFTKALPQVVVLGHSRSLGLVSSPRI